jgi:hypothetical protein
MSQQFLENPLPVDSPFLRVMQDVHFPEREKNLP